MLIAQNWSYTDTKYLRQLRKFQISHVFRTNVQMSTPFLRGKAVYYARFFRFKNGPFLPFCGFIFDIPCTSAESYAPL